MCGGGLMCGPPMGGGRPGGPRGECPIIGPGGKPGRGGPS